jgi:hypothetical protein
MKTEASLAFSGCEIFTNRWRRVEALDPSPARENALFSLFPPVGFCIVTAKPKLIPVCPALHSRSLKNIAALASPAAKTHVRVRYQSGVDDARNMIGRRTTPAVMPYASDLRIFKKGSVNEIVIMVGTAAAAGRDPAWLASTCWGI